MSSWAEGDLILGVGTICNSIVYFKKISKSNFGKLFVSLDNDFMVDYGI
jgi:hypothetical protein